MHQEPRGPHVTHFIKEELVSLQVHFAMCLCTMMPDMDPSTNMGESGIPHCNFENLEYGYGCPNFFFSITFELMNLSLFATFSVLFFFLC